MKDDLIWWSQHHVVHKMNALRHHHHVELMVWTCAERCISTDAMCAPTQMQSYALVSFAANICTFKWSIMHLYASICIYFASMQWFPSSGTKDASLHHTHTNTTPHNIYTTHTYTTPHTSSLVPHHLELMYIEVYRGLYRGI
jgi:hypothetical protein